MPKTHDVTADWRVVDPDTLPANLSAAYAEYKETYKLMKSARIAFETSMSAAAALPATSRLAFGYNFGRLSIAVIPNTPRPASAPARSTSLADFLTSTRAAGFRT
jgi:hypothetical protein